MLAKAISRLLLLTTVVLLPLTAHAKPQHKSAVASFYGDALPESLKSCNLCHLSDDEIAAATAGAYDNEAQPWNAFGRALLKLGEEQVAAGAQRPESIIDRLRALADADADGDGVANELEIFAGTKPAVATDRPNDEQLASIKPRLEKFRRGIPLYPWKPTQKVVRPEVPKPEQNPIDALIAVEHARQGLKPRPEAAKEVLLRRVSIDLIGLPPTREELAVFLADQSPEAYGKVVDRLLQDPRYGERWGRHWMDIWRYSDWAGWGDQVRDSHPHIWRWRDWIVESLNADKPYDEMVVEMLAADEAKPGDPDAARATGFLVRNFKLLSREQWMLDTVDHTSRALLGVTFKCAQCHDHMYDPLTHEEYFQFRAIFEPYQVRIDRVAGELDTKKNGLARIYDANPDAKTQFYLRGDERTPDPERKITPGVPQFLGGAYKPEPVTLSYVDYYPSLRETVIADLIKQAEATIAQRQMALMAARSASEGTPAAAGSDAIAQAKLEAAQADLAALQARIAADKARYIEQKDEAAIKQLATEASKLERQAKLAAAEAALKEAQAALDAAADDKKADPQKKLDEATKARAAAAEAAAKEDVAYTPLGEIYSKTSSGRRLAFAKWLTSRDNPLAARVAVNHLWTRHFGRGLVETVDDFGQNGRRPVHPALLDWLAAELMEPQNASAKPWSMKHVHRLIVLSNTYRQGSAYDAASAALDPDNRYHWRMTPRRMEAEAVRDSVLYLAGSLDATRGGPEIDQKQALSVPRRSLYFRSAPEKQAVFMQIFDTAAPTECYRRRDSIVPQQALALANSELTVKQSRKLGRSLPKESFIVAAFQQILSRAPTADETTECETFLSEQAARFEKQSGTSDVNNLDQPSADPALHARESLIHVLFNHHEFVMLK